MADALRDIIARNRSGAPVAIPSVCSAHPDVLRASLTLAETLDRPLVIEATSNQVNQDGGYTGMTPSDFVARVEQIARESGVARERITFGGDHLGPQAWRDRSAEAAMAKAEAMVAAYVAAGFEKIHLDCSEGCAGEPAQLGDAETAERSALLAEVCLAQGTAAPLFVVGTEVPPPGGARGAEEAEIAPTRPDAARATLDAHIDRFGNMAAHIGALVVQPGVEFGPETVHHLPETGGEALAAVLKDYPGLCFEAHSTDYQRPAAYHRLAALGFAFQKVGPALTHALRAALYRIDALRPDPGGLRRAMEQLMLADPSHWRGHYHGDAAQQEHLRHASLADRIRYYWPDPAARQAVAELRRDAEFHIPENRLRSSFDTEVLDRAEGLRGPLWQRLVDAEIQQALAPYFLENRR